MQSIKKNDLNVKLKIYLILKKLVNYIRKKK